MKYLSTLLLFFSTTISAQTFDESKIKELARNQLPVVIREFREMLSIPNDALYKEHVTANVQFMTNAFTKRGFNVRKLSTGGSAVLVAARSGKQAEKTVLFYLHIDGQPVDSSKWYQESPYIPVLKRQGDEGWEQLNWTHLDNDIDPELRIFARSASDAKGPVAMFLGAIDIIDENMFSPNYDMKVIMDFEEEMGSPYLPGAVEKYSSDLAADMLVILDGPRHISNQPTLTFGARGITTITLTVFGPIVPQHSGHYGNYAPNPAFKLSRLLASMKDEKGVVQIPGYYDGIILDEGTKRILRGVPDDEEMIRKNIGVAEIDAVASNYQESIQYPSLNIRGLQSGWIGNQARTIIPAIAVAEIDVRLVKESNSNRLVGLINDHIKDQGYYFVDGEPTEEERAKHPNLISMTSVNSYSAFRTPFDSDVGIWLNNAMVRAFNKEPIRIRTSGGSIPIAPFVSILNVPAVTVPTVNRDNNQHSPNENIRMGNLEEGIRTCLAILTEKVDK